MLIPKEKPFIQGLNSYYLNLEKLVEHLQGEIGSGCIYGKASSKELLVFFDEEDIIRAVVQENNKQAIFHPDLADVNRIFEQNNFVVTIFYLEPNAIFFWGNMQPFQKAKSALRSTEIPLPDLIFRLRQKQFSGFIDVQVIKVKESGLLFFHNGERIGGSYSWGKGGMSKSNEDYNSLLSKVQHYEGVFTFGSFLEEESIKEVKPGSEENSTKVEKKVGRVVNPVSTRLRPALEEYLFAYIQTCRDSGIGDPVIVLTDYINSHLNNYPYLDPFKGYFEYSKGIVKLSIDAPKEKIAKALVTCVWTIIRAYKIEAVFRQKISVMKHKSIFEHHNIPLEI